MLKPAKLIAAAAAVAACSDVRARLVRAKPFHDDARRRVQRAVGDGVSARRPVARDREARRAEAVLDRDATQTGDVTGVPAVEYAGQGGFGDVVLHPDFAANGLVYLSYAEPGERGTAGAAVARARLALNAAGGGALENLSRDLAPDAEGRRPRPLRASHRVWARRLPLYQLRRAAEVHAGAGPGSKTSARSCVSNDDGSVPADNPFAERGGVTAQIWSLGHRNPLGSRVRRARPALERRDGPARRRRAESRAARRELRLSRSSATAITTAAADIPDHDTRPDLAAPAVFWNPVISPSSLLFYSGSEFPDWQGDAFIGGLSSTSIVRIEFGEGGTAREAARYRMPQRMRAVEQGPDGAIWALEDGRGGRLLKLTAPAAPGR